MSIWVKKMILLIYPKHSPYPHSVSAPLSIFCLGSYLEERGVEVEYFDERLEDWEHFFRVLKKNPVLVGVSAMTSYQIKRAIALASLVRRYNPRIPLVWGGVHPTMCPSQTMESELVDFVVKGEGEDTLFELIEHLGNSKTEDFSHIKGLVWKNEGRITENTERPFLDINSLPFVYSGKSGAMLKVYLDAPTSREAAALQTSRGCNFHCAFCYNNFFNKSVCRVKSKDKLDEEIQRLACLGVREIIFVDDNLAVNREHIYNLCEITQKCRIRWSGGLRIDIIDEEMISRLEKGGCQYIFFGIESVNETIAKYISKGLNLKKINPAIELMAKSSISVVYSFMNGFPGEDKDRLRQQLDFVDYVLRTSPRAEIALQPYNPLPGTPLFQEALRQGFKTPEKLSGWWRMTTGEVLGPWVKDKALLKNLYLISFLIFRGERFLKSPIFFPLYKIARLRWKFRFFKFCFERWSYLLLVGVCVILDDFKLILARIRWNLA